MEPEELTIPKVRVAPSIQGIHIPTEYRDPWVKPGVVVEVTLYDEDHPDEGWSYRGTITSRYAVRIKSAYVDEIRVGDWYKAKIRKV